MICCRIYAYDFTREATEQETLTQSVPTLSKNLQYRPQHQGTQENLQAILCPRKNPAMSSEHVSQIWRTQDFSFKRSTAIDIIQLSTSISRYKVQALYGFPDFRFGLVRLVFQTLHLVFRVPDYPLESALYSVPRRSSLQYFGHQHCHLPCNDRNGDPKK